MDYAFKLSHNRQHEHEQIALDNPGFQMECMMLALNGTSDLVCSISYSTGEAFWIVQIVIAQINL